MTDAERLKLGEDRKLIFENLANGVPLPEICTTFRRSETEIWRETAFVAKKITEYRFRRYMPPLACGDLVDIRRNRKALLETLAHLGPNYLSSELLLPRIKAHEVENQDHLQEAVIKVGATVRTQ